MPEEPVEPPATRVDLYRVAAFLRELDRMLHPATARPSGQYRLPPWVAPPLPPSGAGRPREAGSGASGWLPTRAPARPAAPPIDIPWVEPPVARTEQQASPGLEPPVPVLAPPSGPPIRTGYPAAPGSPPPVLARDPAPVVAPGRLETAAAPLTPAPGESPPGPPGPATAAPAPASVPYSPPAASPSGPALAGPDARTGPLRPAPSVAVPATGPVVAAPSAPADDPLPAAPHRPAGRPPASEGVPRPIHPYPDVPPGAAVPPPIGRPAPSPAVGPRPPRELDAESTAAQDIPVDLVDIAVSGIDDAPVPVEPAPDLDLDPGEPDFPMAPASPPLPAGHGPRRDLTRPPAGGRDLDLDRGRAALQRLYLDRTLRRSR